jgi:hypothetical protein
VYSSLFGQSLAWLHAHWAIATQSPQQPPSTEGTCSAGHAGANALHTTFVGLHSDKLPEPPLLGPPASPGSMPPLPELLPVPPLALEPAAAAPLAAPALLAPAEALPPRPALAMPAAPLTDWPALPPPFGSSLSVSPHPATKPNTAANIDRPSQSTRMSAF